MTDGINLNTTYTRNLIQTAPVNPGASPAEPSSQTPLFDTEDSFQFSAEAVAAEASSDTSEPRPFPEDPPDGGG